MAYNPRPVGKDSTVWSPGSMPCPQRGCNRVDSKFQRSDNYRRNFLKHKRGLFGSRVYVCTYCGKLIGVHGMQVDHCISVGASQRYGLARSFIRLRGFFSGRKTYQDGVNAVWNLVPSCPSCNNKKSDNAGIWVLRGIIGRYLFPLLWYIGIIFLLYSVGVYLFTGGGVLSTVVDALMKIRGVFGGV